jgi:hypothetical protein
VPSIRPNTTAWSAVSPTPATYYSSAALAVAVGVAVAVVGAAVVGVGVAGVAAGTVFSAVVSFGHRVVCSIFYLLKKVRRQTFEEAWRDFPKEFLDRQADKHPLAVGCDHIFAVGEHSVKACAARHYVLEYGPVVGEEHVVARSPREVVFRRFAVRAVDQEVVASCAHHVVEAGAAKDYVVAGASHQVLVASGCPWVLWIITASHNHIFATPAY